MAAMKKGYKKMAKVHGHAPMVKMADGGAVNAHKRYAMGGDPLAAQNAVDGGGKKSKFSKGGKAC